MYWQPYVVDRNHERDDFLRQSGWAGADCRAITGDMSARRYFRVSKGVRPHASAVLMDAGPDSAASNRAFLAIGEWLRSFGFSAPATINADLDTGFLLLEDLGEETMLSLCSAQPKLQIRLYRQVIEMLRYLHTIPAPGVLSYGVNLPTHDNKIYVPQTRIVLEYYAPQLFHSELVFEFDRLVGALCCQLSSDRKVLVLRDFHAGNLVWLANRSKISRIGLLDYQDALIGHPAYDLVSLLQDARRNVDSDFEQVMIAEYLKGRTDEPSFRRDYAALGAQRNLRILGIFARAAAVDSGNTYGEYLRRVWGYVCRNLDHPDLGELRDWVYSNLTSPDQQQRATEHRRP